MPYIISVVSQKRGAGKSTIARMIAVEFVRLARMDGGCRKVLLANQDPSQTKRHEARYRCQTICKSRSCVGGCWQIFSEIRQLIDKVEIFPKGERGPVEIKVHGLLAALLGNSTPHSKEWWGVLVAGAGFEPATFRL